MTDSRKKYEEALADLFVLVKEMRSVSDYYEEIARDIWKWSHTIEETIHAIQNEKGETDD